jgi:DNA-binding transcriptional MerR regulator
VSELTVSRLAEQVGISADTVRYYERIGLLPEPDRSPSGYRLYDDDAVERLRFVKRAQRLGLRLEEVGELMEIRERGLCPCGHTRGLLERRVQALDEEMAAMALLRRDITQMLDQLPAAESGREWRCSSELLQITPKGREEAKT